jgi:hypothetical protein
MKNKKLKKRRLLISYFTFNYLYENGALCTINGRQDGNAARPRLGTIGRVKNAQLPMRSHDRNFKNFLYIYRNDVRALYVNVTTAKDSSGITTQKTLFTLHYIPKKSSREPVMLARDITLFAPPPDPSADPLPAPVEIVINPSGIAQMGGWIYLIDYDSQKIYYLRLNELNGLPDGSNYTLTRRPLDLLGLVPELGADAKGVAIGAARDPAGARYLYALYNNPETSLAEGYYPSTLVRLVISATGVLAYDTKVEMGLNTPELNILTLGTGEKYVVTSAIGGMIQGGSTNERLSTIMSVPAFGPWDNDSPVELLRGADIETGEPYKAYDIHGIAASPRPDSDGKVLIITGYYNTPSYSGLKWRFYETTVARMLNARNETLPDAVELGILTELEDGETLSPGDLDPVFYGVYFLNGLYEAGKNPRKDRYWIFRGTELLVTLSGAYGSPAKPANPYRFFPRGFGVDSVGGQNVQSAELPIELTRQVIAGTAHKRGITALRIPRTGDDDDDN